MGAYSASIQTDSQVGLGGLAYAPLEDPDGDPCLFARQRQINAKQ